MAEDDADHADGNVASPVGWVFFPLAECLVIGEKAALDDAGKDIEQQQHAQRGERDKESHILGVDGLLVPEELVKEEDQRQCLDNSNEGVDAACQESLLILQFAQQAGHQEHCAGDGEGHREQTAGRQ